VRGNGQTEHCASVEPVTTNPVTAVRAVDGAVASPAVRRDLAAHTEPSLTINVELLGWLVVLVVAALFRLLDLSAIPLRPDESLRAWSAFEFSRGTVTPEWGGDLGSALAALTFRLAGDSDTTARLVPAMAGILAVGCVAFYRSLLGRGAALIGALLIAVSPVAIANARTLGPEAVALPLALLLPPLTASVWLDDRRSRLPLLAFVFGLGLGTGALVPAVAIVLLAWLAVERGWLNPSGAAEGASDRPWDRTLLAVSVLALLPGLLLAVTRYGAGLDRLTLAAVRAWNGPPAVAAPPQPWHWVPDVLIAYEPLALALGVVGAVLVLRRWPSPDNAGGRLLVIWAVAGLLLTLFWLHRDPAQLLLATVPLALLAGVATATASQTLGRRSLGRMLLGLLPLVPAAGFTLAMLVRWANSQRIEAGEAVSVALVLFGGAVATVAALTLLRAPLGTALLTVVWALLGGLTLHAAANVAFGGGSEFLAGQRTLPQVEAIVLRLETGVDADQPVRVERRLWPALAWPLRDRAVHRFVENPPPGGPAVIATTTGVQATSGPFQDRVPVVERWAPGGWDNLGILRWWVNRTPWDGATPQGASVVNQ